MGPLPERAPGGKSPGGSNQATHHPRASVTTGPKRNRVYEETNSMGGDRPMAKITVGASSEHCD